VTSASASAPPNGFTVEIRRGEAGWSVAIVDPAGVDASVRPCRDEVEAHTYASTVRQHAYWLSEVQFRRYYRLLAPQGM
jgi:hypothetical protein